MRRTGIGLLLTLTLAATAPPTALAGPIGWRIDRISIDDAGASGVSQAGQFDGLTATVGSWPRDRLNTLFQVIPASTDGSLPSNARALTGTVAFRVQFSDPAQPSAVDLPTITVAVTYDGTAFMDAEGRISASVAGTATTLHVERAFADGTSFASLIDSAPSSAQLSDFTAGTNLPPELLDAFLQPGRYHIAGSLLDDPTGDLELALRLDAPGATAPAPTPLPVPEPTPLAAWALFSAAALSLSIHRHRKNSTKPSISALPTETT
jgi:hypothetical protein